MIIARVLRRPGVVIDIDRRRTLCWSRSFGSLLESYFAGIPLKNKQKIHKDSPGFRSLASNSTSSSHHCLRYLIMMDNKSDHEDSERVDIQDQLKREGEKEILDELSPPAKKRVMETEEGQYKLWSEESEHLENIKNSAQVVGLVSENTEQESVKPHSTCDEERVPLNSRSDSVESIAGSFKSTDNLSSCEVSLGLNETECESLESSLYLRNSLDDLSTSVFDFESNKDESEAGYSAAHVANDNKVKKKKKKHKKRRKSEQDNGERPSSSGGNPYVPNMRPNFFVGVQISNSEIHKNIIEVQEALIEHEPALSKALVDVATSHITLLIARIDDENSLSLACSALDDFSKDYDKDLKPLKLTFSGVDNFSNNVLYARVVEDEHHKRLLDLADTLRQVFAGKGICLPNMKPLNPHLTIAKMSKAPRGKGKPGPRKIEPLSYANYKDLYLGYQIVSSLQLLAMNLPKDEKRYYYCCKEIHFGENSVHKYDHSKCCFPRRPLIPNQHRSFSTKASGNETNYLGPAVGFATALAASLMIVYVVGKVSGKL